MGKKVRVRYAPSPTGYQHIGGIRTALFNYLFAKANKGDFILRIEDTDQSRFFEGALNDIFQTFEWLNIDYDEGPKKGGDFGPYFQSERTEIYQKYADELIKSGHAYRCYCSPERLENVRNQQEKDKSSQGYDRQCRYLSSNEIEALEKEGIGSVIRLKAPTEGTTSFEDMISGKIEVDNSTLQDFILLKSDGFPTYHLANIIDDHLMQITHVLRAQEWISSTPNHVLLYKAFNWDPPQFCHLPMVMGEDGQKLSKRHGATQVKDFRDRGYLAEAIINFIVLLGWSYNDKDEIFSIDKLKKIFSIKKINKSSATFNYQKLNWFNGIYIRQMNEKQLTEAVLPFYIEKGLISDPPTKEEIGYIKKIIPLIQERIELINNAPDISDFMFGELPPYKTWDAIVPKNTNKNTVLKILESSKSILKKVGKKSNDDLQQQLYALSKEYDVKAGAVFMPVRIAITGINKSPEIFPVIKVLGIARTLKRIDSAIEKLKNDKNFG